MIHLFRQTHSALLTLALASLVAMTVACGASTPSDRPSGTNTTTDGGYQQPGNMQYTVSWTQDDTLDLATPDATFIRAFLESAGLMLHVTSARDAYPGFESAMQPAIAPEDADHRGGLGQTYGEEHNRIAEFTELPGNTVRVTGCRRYPWGHPSNPVSASPRPDQGSVMAFMLVYQRKGEAPPANQRGQRTVPYGSVFGDWNALEYDPLYGPEHPEAVSPCIGNNFNPDTGNPPTPGWPTGPQPMA